MNLSKTKIKSVEENVYEYVYLGHNIINVKENETTEIIRRDRLALGAFGKLSYALKSRNLPINLKRLKKNGINKQKF